MALFRRQPRLKALLSLIGVATIFYLFWHDQNEQLAPDASVVQSSQYTDRIYHHLPEFLPGPPKPPGVTYSRVLVIPHLKNESVSWVEDGLPNVHTAIYTVDDAKAGLHPPKNKGNEVMVYLTYIIDNYKRLPDVMIFMHAHQRAWHNNDILGNDAVEMVQRLSSEWVVRNGYVNLRCHWKPGCPEWIGTGHDDIVADEDAVLSQFWSEVFPGEVVPTNLAQPCCAQFAVSRERMQAIPLQRWVLYRDWLLRTDMSDYLAGRLWEYSWQYVFTGNAVVCPDMRICYCEGYGACFGGEEMFQLWFKLRHDQILLRQELETWELKTEKVKAAAAKGEMDQLVIHDYPELGRDKYLRGRISAIWDELYRMKEEALERGRDPKNRALEAGRPSREGGEI